MAQKAKNIKRYTNLYVKRRLLKLEIDIFGIITQFLKHKISKIQAQHRIKALILDLAVQIQLDQAEVTALWRRSQMMLQDLVKHTAYKIRKGQSEEHQNEMIYSYIRANIQDGTLIKDSNQVMYMYEQRMKHLEVEQLLDPNAQKFDSPFFLCSAHPNPAKDHAAWEGKMYYDAHWEEKGSYSDQQKRAIRAYIRNHDLASVQWVTGAPVYLVMRPNCKHYLMQIQMEEVLHGSARSLLKKHKMYMRDEKPATEKRLNYRQYYNRSKVEEAVNALIPNKKLELDMKKTKDLVRKWA